MALTETYRVTLKVMKTITIRALSATDAVTAAESREDLADVISTEVEDMVQIDNKGNIIE